jgi:hypothetical protein
MQTYINNVLATVTALDLQILEYWVDNPAAAHEDKNFKQIKYDIDAAITKIKVRHAQVTRKASVRLEGGAREKIRELINKIKLTIEAIEIPLPRKEALMSRLNDFAAEVDKDRTRFEAFGALMIEAAGVARKVERKLRPIPNGLVPSLTSCTRPARLRTPALACPRRTSEADCAAVWRAVGTAEAAKSCRFRRRYSVLVRKPRRSPSGLPRRKAFLSRTP